MGNLHAHVHVRIACNLDQLSNANTAYRVANHVQTNWKNLIKRMKGREKETDRQNDINSECECV